MFRKVLNQWAAGVAPGQAGPARRLALDVGTEYIKAVVVELPAAAEGDPRGLVVATGRARQAYGGMESGAVSDIDAVVDRCRLAVEEAITGAGGGVSDAVVGIAGEFVKGLMTRIRHDRRHPERPIGWSELVTAAGRAHREGFARARKELASDTGYEDIDVQLVNSALVDVRIDGYRVANPRGFQGRHLEVTVFHTFAPLVHIGALATIVERVGLRLLAMVAEPFAVASAVLTPEAREFGALVIDIGGGTTDIAVVDGGGITGTRMVGIGGRAFTRALAQGLNLPLLEAEERKLDYAAGVLAPEHRDQVAALLADDLAVWRDAVRIALEGLKGQVGLPQRVLLCGGGSALPGIADALRGDAFAKHRLFAGPVDVVLLDAEEIAGVRDGRSLLRGQQDVTPKGLAYQAALAGEIERAERDGWLLRAAGR